MDEGFFLHGNQTPNVNNDEDHFLRGNPDLSSTIKKDENTPTFSSSSSVAKEATNSVMENSEKNDLKSPSVVNNLLNCPARKKIPIPLPRTSLTRNVTNKNNEVINSNKSESVSLAENIEIKTRSTYSASQITASINIKPVPRRIFTFKSPTDEVENNSTWTSEESNNSKSLTENFNREKSLSMETRRSQLDDPSNLADTNMTRRSLRETSKNGLNYSQNDTRIRSSTGKEALIKLYDLPDAKLEDTTRKYRENTSRKTVVSEEFSTSIKKNNRSSLIEWENVQRMNLEQDEKNRINRNLSNKPVSAMIKEMVRFPGSGLKYIFNKEKKADMMGTVDAADDIVFTRIPSDTKDKIDAMKSPNMVKNILQRDGKNITVTEESIYSDVHGVVEHNGSGVLKPSSPIYVKTSTDRFDSEVLFGERGILSNSTTTKQMNNERSKDNVKLIVSPVQRRNKSPRKVIQEDAGGVFSPVKGVVSQIKNSYLMSTSDEPKLVSQNFIFRRSMRESTPEKRSMKITNSNSASSLVDLERRQRFEDASAVFKKENGRKATWNDDRIPLYTSSWKFLSSKREEENISEQQNIPSFLDSRSPPVRLTQIIGDSESQSSSTPLVSPRLNTDQTETVTNSINDQNSSINNFTNISGPAAPPRKSKLNMKSTESYNSSLSKITQQTTFSNVAYVDEHGIHDPALPPVAPKRKSFHFGCENNESYNNNNLEGGDIKNPSTLNADDYMLRSRHRGKGGYDALNERNQYSPEEVIRKRQLRVSPEGKRLQNVILNDSSNSKVQQRISRRERSRLSDDNRMMPRVGHRHMSADRYLGYSYNDERKSRDHSSNKLYENPYKRSKEAERRVKVTTYKWRENIVKENTEKYIIPISGRKDVNSRGESSEIGPSRRYPSDRGGDLPGSDVDRHGRSSRRLNYDKRRSEIQRRSRSEGRPGLLIQQSSGDRLVAEGRSRLERLIPFDEEEARRRSRGRRDPTYSRDRQSSSRRDHTSNELSAKKQEIYSSSKNENVYYTKKQPKRVDVSKSTVTASVSAPKVKDKNNALLMKKSNRNNELKTKEAKQDQNNISIREGKKMRKTEEVKSRRRDKNKQYKEPPTKAEVSNCFNLHHLYLCCSI